MGKGRQIFAKAAKNGAKIQLTLEMVEHVPTAWLLKFVGYISDVIKNIIAKAMDDAPLPNFEKNIKKAGFCIFVINVGN